MWQALRRLIAANPMGFFLWSIITKWYLIIAVASLITLYYTVLGLKKIGFIDYFTKTMVEILDVSKAVAQNCTTKLGPDWNHLVSFWNCLSEPGEYQYEERIGSKELEDAINKLRPRQVDSVADAEHPIINPYEQLSK
ncbi:hypothetical protein RCA_01465 [Rickettsia canadensis str. CA410]|uniref:Uncharacterized protein n=1 Tax=Rickettsia canadensis str. CA410 TaxID=1105107 RepID=A0ABN4AGF7_RICCA|nr:hypothetical protein RCA_01465 [Rickettsia canadensis str. CA410]